MRPFWKLVKPATKQKAIGFANSSHRVKRLKSPKEHAKNVSTRHCSSSMQKLARQTQLIFEKWDHSENWQEIATKQRLEPFAKWSLCFKN